jgi:hypothetical protein
MTGSSLSVTSRGSRRSRAIDLACGTAGNKPAADLFGGTALTASESPRSGDGVTGATICRRLCLK